MWKINRHSSRRRQRKIFSCPRVGKRTNTNSKEKTDIFDFIKIKNFFTKKLNWKGRIYNSWFLLTLRISHKKWWEILQKPSQKRISKWSYKHMTTWSPSSVTWEMQAKPQWGTTTQPPERHGFRTSVQDNEQLTGVQSSATTLGTGRATTMGHARPWWSSDLSSTRANVNENVHGCVRYQIPKLDSLHAH